MNFQLIKNGFKKKRVTLIYIFYWFMVIYMIAALVFWYIALNIQNTQITRFKEMTLEHDSISYADQFSEIKKEEERKTFQYIGEGLTFFLIIAAGAVVVFRMLRTQLRLSSRQRDFMMAITHELKTPIAVLKLNLETIHKRNLDDERRGKLLRASLSETERLNALCSNMLLLNQMDATGYAVTSEELSVNELLSDCLKDFKSRYPEKELRDDIQPDIYITGDHMLLKLAINNLLDNAVKYSPKDTPLTVKARRDETGSNIQIIDEGMGISADDLKHIYEKFYRGIGIRTKGTGIGLYVTRQIVKLSGGTISIKPNLPKGSVFTISFASPK